MAVKPVISVSKKATKLMLYVYLCECGGGPGHSGTKPKGKRREERRKRELSTVMKKMLNTTLNYNSLSLLFLDDLPTSLYQILCTSPCYGRQLNQYY
jgi:hypothetical protein